MADNRVSLTNSERGSAPYLPSLIPIPPKVILKIEFNRMSQRKMVATLKSSLKMTNAATRTAFVT